MEDVANNLYNMRLKAGFSQRDLAAASGLARSTIQRIESRISWPEADTIRKWMAACARR